MHTRVHGTRQARTTTISEESCCLIEETEREMQRPLGRYLTAHSSLGGASLKSGARNSIQSPTWGTSTCCLPGPLAGSWVGNRARLKPRHSSHRECTCVFRRLKVLEGFLVLCASSKRHGAGREDPFFAFRLVSVALWVMPPPLPVLNHHSWVQQPTACPASLLTHTNTHGPSAATVRPPGLSPG